MHQGIAVRHQIEEVIGVQVGDQDRVDVDVVTDQAKLGEYPVTAVEQQPVARLLDQVAAACPAGVLPRRRLAQNGDLHCAPLRFIWHSSRVAVAANHFEISLLTFGGLLVVGALISGLAGRSFLSLTALFVLSGFVLGDGVIGVLHFEARSPFVADLATIALIVILFRDGLEVEAEMLQAHWHLPLRKLVLAMPLTAVIVAAAARLLVGLSWTESLLLGALLSPTDPVLSSSVVTNPRVPRLIRHSLNLESGLNDGLALPAVLAFSAALAAGNSQFVWWRFVLEDVGIGFATGLVVGFVGARLMRRDDDLSVA